LKVDCSDERKKTNDDPDELEEEHENMTLADRNVIGKFWLQKFRDWSKKGISMRHPTPADAKRIQDGGGLVIYIQEKVVPVYQRFQGCDFEAKEGAMEYCWHPIRKQMAFLCSPKDIYPPRKALTPEQTATKLVRNERTKIE
jgi:hypothetical protein